MISRCFKSFPSVVILLAVMAPALVAQSGSDTVQSNRILPQDTYLHFSISSISQLKERAGASAMGRMIFSEEMADFRNAITGAAAAGLQQGASQIESQLGVTMDELMQIPAGEISLSFSKAPPNKMGAVLYVDFGDSKAAVDSLLEKAAVALRSAPSLEEAPDEYDGTELVMFTNTSESADMTPLAKEFGWFVRDSRLVISNSSALMKLMIDNWDGSADKTLASHPVYSYILENCETSPGSGLATAFADPMGMFTQLVQTGSLGQAGLQAGMAMSVFPMLGLNQLKGMGIVMEMGTGEFDSVSRAMIYADQPPMFLMQAFQMDQVDRVPASWIKDNVTAWVSMNWKLEETWKTAESMVDMFQGPGALARMVDQLAEQEPGIHIRNDIIDQMDGTMQFVTAGSGRSTSTGTDDVLIAFGIRDTQKFADLLAKVTSQPGFPGEMRQLEGATIYELAMGPGQPALSFTAANNMLMLSVGGNQLEMALRNTPDVRPLAETEEFAAVLAHVPENAVAISYARPAEQYKAVYEMLRNDEAAENFPGADQLLMLVDFSLLPPFEQIEKYMTPAGSYWISDENGIKMESFTLPTQE